MGLATIYPDSQNLQRNVWKTGQFRTNVPRGMKSGNDTI